MPEPASRPTPDWGLGAYEPTAATLEPATDRVIERAAITPGDPFLDVGCGTGNAALAAARAGAVVTGLDPAARLLEVARERAAAEGLDASFIQGDAGALPFPDGAFVTAVSIFGVIFAPDPPKAIAELIRVLRPGGHALVTAWVPEGPIHESVGVAMRAVAAATGSPPAAGFAWHDEAVLGPVVAEHGARLEMHEDELAFTAPSLEAYLTDVQAVHPMSVAMSPLLEQAGLLADVQRESSEKLREGNEDPDAFRVTSRYRIADIERPA